MAPVQVYAYIFCSQEGMVSTFLQAPCLPVMHDAAQAALVSEPHTAHSAQRTAHSAQPSDAPVGIQYCTQEKEG